MVRALGIAGAVTALLAGCGADDRPAGTGEATAPPQACTQIGCASAVTVRVRRAPPDARTARACAGGRCRSWRLRERELDRVPLDIPEERETPVAVGVSVTLRDREGSVIVAARRRLRLERMRPNGPDCPPVCHNGGVTLDGDSGRLRPIA